MPEKPLGFFNVVRIVGIAGSMQLLLVCYFILVVPALLTRPELYAAGFILFAVTALFSRGQLFWRVSGGAVSWFTGILLAVYYVLRTGILWDYLEYWLAHLVPAGALIVCLGALGWAVASGRRRLSWVFAGAATVSTWAIIYLHDTLPNPQTCCPW